MTDDMTDKQVSEIWQSIAVEIGNHIYRQVNTPEMVGGEDETGYVLMFFNTKNHGGKSTIVSSEQNIVQLKKLLKTAAKQVDRAKLINQMSGLNS